MDTEIKKAEPRDIFLHLLQMVSLYASAVSFLVLLFQYINYFVYDPLEVSFADSVLGPMRWAIAVLLIIFPTYILTTRYLNRGYDLEPERRSLRIRKWLIYFTLFIAAIILLGDLVSLIYTFLNGDMTLKFLLKVLAFMFVAGNIFFYYFWDIKQHKV